MTYAYDNLQRLKKESYGDGSYITYTYYGNSQKVEGKQAFRNGESESYIETLYDRKDRPVTIFCNDVSWDLYSSVDYSYDTEGKVLTESNLIKGVAENTIKYAYDNEGRLISKEYPSKAGLGTVNFEYDTQCNDIKISHI